MNTVSVSPIELVGVAGTPVLGTAIWPLATTVIFIKTQCIIELGIRVAGCVLDALGSV